MWSFTVKGTKGDCSSSHSKSFSFWNSVDIDDTNWLTASHNYLGEFIITLTDSVAGTPPLLSYLPSRPQSHWYGVFHCNVNWLLSRYDNFLVGGKWKGIRTARCNRQFTNVLDKLICFSNSCITLKIQLKTDFLEWSLLSMTIASGRLIKVTLLRTWWTHGVNRLNVDCPK